jgi:hypothetical protein
MVVFVVRLEWDNDVDVGEVLLVLLFVVVIVVIVVEVPLVILFITSLISRLGRIVSKSHSKSSLSSEADLIMQTISHYIWYYL